MAPFDAVDMAEILEQVVILGVKMFGQVGSLSQVSMLEMQRMQLQLSVNPISDLLLTWQLHSLLAFATFSLGYLHIYYLWANSSSNIQQQVVRVQTLLAFRSLDANQADSVACYEVSASQ